MKTLDTSGRGAAVVRMNVPNARPALILSLELTIEHSLETRDTSFDRLRASQACRGTLHEERMRSNFATNRQNHAY